MNEAKAKPRINFLRLILFALVAIVLSGGVFAVFYLMFRQRDASLTYEKLDIDANMDYHVSGGYLTYASGHDAHLAAAPGSRRDRPRLHHPV